MPVKHSAILASNAYSATRIQGEVLRWIGWLLRTRVDHVLQKPTCCLTTSPQSKQNPYLVEATNDPAPAVHIRRILPCWHDTLTEHLA